MRFREQWNDYGRLLITFLWKVNRYGNKKFRSGIETVFQTLMTSHHHTTSKYSPAIHPSHFLVNRWPWQSLLSHHVWVSLMFEIQIHYRLANLFSPVVSCKTIILLKVILHILDQTDQAISPRHYGESGYFP
jgi:hypothetical protein